MRNNAFLAAGLLTLALAACGSSEPAPVVEQIVVREPGEEEEPASLGEDAPELAPGAEAASNPERTPEQEAKRAALIAAGEETFQLCTGCHNADPGGPHQAGPNLHGIMGRQAGSKPDYPYSEALASSGITWNYASLDRFLANPAGYVEGTSMVAGAVRDGQERAAIVAYLASTSD